MEHTGLMTTIPLAFVIVAGAWALWHDTKEKARGCNHRAGDK